ncbi:hypothetical protein B0H10DRAFT_363373 [Mycena sp. CBHHK59/15]|nr:hypothetical protein B0H10DRAFT_363373 [Mycena sp. CBHHK59/15]
MHFMSNLFLVLGLTTRSIHPYVNICQDHDYIVSSSSSPRIVYMFASPSNNKYDSQLQSIFRRQTRWHLLEASRDLLIFLQQAVNSLTLQHTNITTPHSYKFPPYPRTTTALTIFDPQDELPV